MFHLAPLRRLARYDWMLWTILLVGIIVFRWPVLKGYYYRAAGIAAPAAVIPWQTSLEAALTEARRTGRPVLAEFGASWCPPCIAMQHDVWPDPEVARAVARDYVPLAVDVDRDARLSEQYRIDGIPTILIIDPDGKVTRRAGFLPRSGMLRFLSEHR